MSDEPRPNEEIRSCDETTPSDVIFNRYKIPQGAAQTPEGGPVPLFGKVPVVRLRRVEDDQREHNRRRSVPGKVKITWKAFCMPLERTSQLFHMSFLVPVSAAAPGQEPGDRLRERDVPREVISSERFERSAMSNRALEVVSEDELAAFLDGLKLSCPISLYLFNVLVACEWEPTEQDLRRLQWAFTRASSFLYDATNGHMAFGQVVLGGPAMMGCADIQIMASNRLYPRSWVGGIASEAKNRPIRLGSGLWHMVQRVAMAWDEPEGYRTIIHEWGHYALHLRDAYLETVPTILVGDTVRLSGADGSLGIHPHALRSARLHVVTVPTRGALGEGIMAAIEGTSELALRTDRPATEAAGSYEWTVLQQHYPAIGEFRAYEGPRELRLPLPAFPTVDAAPAGGDPVTGEQAAGYAPARDLSPWKTADYELFLEPHQLFDGPAADLAAQGISPDRCWLYLLNEAGAPERRLIAQGTFDRRSTYRPLRLLGVTPEMTRLIAIIPTLAHRPAVFEGDLGSAVQSGSRYPQPEPLHIAFTPAHIPPVLADAPPVVVVLPDPPVSQRRQEQFPKLFVQVRVTITSGPPPRAVWLFPLGMRGILLEGEDGRYIVEEALPQLDGHVMLEWPEGVMLYPFSHGGDPPSHNPSGTVPITAGSSDGSVLVFFNDPHAGQPETEASRHGTPTCRIVTTTNSGVHGSRPAPDAEPRGYPFALAIDRPLPPDPRLHPTLVVRFDPLHDRDGDMLLCRLDHERWVAQPTYVPPYTTMAAMPLSYATAPRLLVPLDGKPGVEHYQLFWIPRP